MSGFFRRKDADAQPSDEVPADGWALRLLLASTRPLGTIAGWMGADREGFRAILSVKLRLDMRVGGLKNPNKPVASGLLVTCAVDHLLGWVLAAVSVSMHDARAVTALACGMMMILLSMALITDLTDLLLAPADVTILGARPVSPRTMLLVRVGHALLYTGLLAACLAVPTWIVGAFIFPPVSWLVLFGLAAVLAALTTLLAITAIFALLLRMTHPERVRNVVLFAQIVGSLITFGGYYVLIGLTQSPTVTAWLKSEHTAQLLLPPYWFAALATADRPAPSSLQFTLMALAVAIPALLAFASMRLAGRDLLQRMAALDEGGGPAVFERSGLLRRLGRKLVKPGLERAGFDLFLGLAARERQFRQRVYPLLAMPAMMMMYCAWTGRHLHGSDSSNQGWMMCAYLPVVYSLSILQIVRFSDTPKAAWIYAAAPVEQYGLLVCGTVKALCFAFLLPWYLVLFTCTGLVFGGLNIPDMAFATLIVLATTLWLARRMLSDALPFTRTFRTAQSSSQMVLFLVVAPVIGLMALVHLELANQPWIVGALAAAAAVLVVVNTKRLASMRLDDKHLVEEA